MPEYLIRFEMSNRLTFPAFIFMLLFFCGCTSAKRNVPQDSTIVSKHTDTIVDAPDTQYESVFDAGDTIGILKKLFDNPRIENRKTAIWQPNYYERMTFPYSEDKKCHTTVDTIMYFVDRAKRKCAVAILGTYDYRYKDSSDSEMIKVGCHFCSYLVGVALFYEDAKDPKKWNLYKFEKAFASMGSWGGAERDDRGWFSLKQIGDSWTCLCLRNPVNGNSGEFIGDERLYSIEEYQLGGFPNHVLSTILEYNYYYTLAAMNGTQLKDERTEMKIKKKKGTYFDIDLVTTDNGKSTVEHYEYSDEFNQFVLKK